ncbi:MAG: hypothetical protein R6X13_07465 [bacterium]
MTDEKPTDGSGAGQPRCGLCGKTGKLTRTECCGQWICDDEDQYVLFSYDRNSCSRNHRRYTLCGYHWAEGHEGRWQDCARCREEIAKTEMYAWYGTNEYNFEKLPNPPGYRPTFCKRCHRRVRLATDGHTLMPDGSIYCEDCAERRHDAALEPSDQGGEDFGRTMSLDSAAIPWLQPTMEDLNAYLERLLRSDWESGDSTIRLAADITPEEVESTLLLDQTRKYLGFVAECGGVELTPNDWLKLAVVKQMVERLDWAQRELEPMRPFVKRVTERNVRPLGAMRSVCEVAGLVRYRRDVMYVPRRVLPLLVREQGGTLYRRLFLALFRQGNLSELYAPQEQTPLFDQSMAVVLWRLGTVARDWIAVNRLSDEVLLESVYQEAVRAAGLPEVADSLLWHRAIEPLVWFGLLECDVESSGRFWFELRSKARVRKTPLFDRFIKFAPVVPLPPADSY